MLAGEAGAPRLFARITLDPHPLDHSSYRIIVNGPADVSGIDASSPHSVAVFSMFGHHAMHGPFSILVPISSALATLRQGKRLDVDAPIQIRVVPEERPVMKGMKHRHGRAPFAEVVSVVIEAH